MSDLPRARNTRQRKPDLFIPLWHKDYLAATANLSITLSGAYLHLLMAYWDRQGPLPDDDRQLAAIVKSTPQAWRKMRPILAAYFVIQGGFWVNKRCDAELSEAREIMQRASNKGAAAANSRWDKSRPVNAVQQENSQNCANPDIPRQCTSNTQALPEQCSLPSPSPSKTLAIASAGQEPGQDPPIVADGLWDRGVDFLATSGVQPRRARECLGRWVQLHGRTAVVAALDRAIAEWPAEPIAYLERVLTDDQTENRRDRKPARLDFGVALDAALAQRRAAEPGEAQIGA